MTELIAASDAIWLQDSATNLMVINAVILAERLELPALRQAFQRRIFEGPEAGRFHRLRCRVAGQGHRRYWEPDPDFDLSRHIVPYRGRRLRNLEAVQAYVGEQAGLDLDRTRPPWQIQLIDGFEPDTSAVLVRIHHSIGDGEALVALLFALVDAPGTRHSLPHPPGGTWLDRLLRAAALPLLAPAILLRRLAWIPDHSRMHGLPLTGHKRVAWTRPLDLDVVKRARRRLGATVNDVLMASVSGAFSHYLAGHGEAPPSRFLISMPVNVRPGTVDRCDNHFAPVPLDLPAGPDDPPRRIQAVKTRLDALKCSCVPAVFFELQRLLLSLLPQPLSKGLIDFLANKCTAVVSNVNGPAGELALAGSKVRSLVFWVPQRAKIGIGISILSFNGKVQVGVMGDEALLPDPGELARAFEAEFEALKRL